MISGHGVRHLVVGAAVVVGAHAGASADAGTILISSVNAQDATYDLSASGSFDWAYWNPTASSLGSSVNPANRRVGGNLIGPLRPAGTGGGGVRGTTSVTVPLYSFAYSDGSGPTSGTVTKPAGLFNTLLGSGGVNNGIQFDVAAPSAVPFQISIWATAFAANATLTATLDGSPPVAVSDTSLQQLGQFVRTPGKMFTLMVTPDSPGQNVNVQLLMTTSGDANANTSLAAVAVAVPEPESCVLLGCLLGWATAWGLRRGYRHHTGGGEQPPSGCLTRRAPRAHTQCGGVGPRPGLPPGISTQEHSR